MTPTRYWDGPFQKPLDAEFTSPFGAWRLYNNSLWGRHTGIDLRGPAGTPLLAPAAGRVVLAERLDVRGNYVLIDHGWGIYSGLAHLSEIHVTRGQLRPRRAGDRGQRQHGAQQRPAHPLGDRRQRRMGRPFSIH